MTFIIEESVALCICSFRALRGIFLPPFSSSLGESASEECRMRLRRRRGDPLRLRREGKLELTETLRSHDRS
jgi:hypothetical protein